MFAGGINPLGQMQSWPKGTVPVGQVRHIGTKKEQNKILFQIKKKVVSNSLTLLIGDRSLGAMTLGRITFSKMTLSKMTF
jgi:hypothetical protein